MTQIHPLSYGYLKPVTRQIKNPSPDSFKVIKTVTFVYEVMKMQMTTYGAKFVTMNRTGEYGVYLQESLFGKNVICPVRTFDKIYLETGTFPHNKQETKQATSINKTQKKIKPLNDHNSFPHGTLLLLAAVFFTYLILSEKSAPKASSLQRRLHLIVHPRAINV